MHFLAHTDLQAIAAELLCHVCVQASPRQGDWPLLCTQHRCEGESCTRSSPPSVSSSPTGDKNVAVTAHLCVRRQPDGAILGTAPEPKRCKSDSADLVVRG